MWCFIDETWISHSQIPNYTVGVIAGILAEDAILPQLDKLLYAVQRKYYGQDHAKDPSRELKGESLLSNMAFSLEERNVRSINLNIVKEILNYLNAQGKEGRYLKLFASAVYGQRPQLLCPDPKNMPLPYRTICRNISRAVADFDENQTAIMVYDQRFKAQTGLAIAMKAFVQGLKIPNLHPVPYFGVSHATPALQVSDILVHIIGKSGRDTVDFNLFTKWQRDFSGPRERIIAPYMG